MPAFQHRHYKAIADVLADLRSDDFNDNPTLQNVEDALCKMFKGDNGRFDADRFRRAAVRAPNMHGKDKVMA